MIILERLTEGDLQLVLRWRMQEHYFFGKKDLQYKDLTMESQKIWLKNINENENCIYWVIKSGSIKIGIAGVNHIDYEEKRCDVECVIGDQHFRNRGIMPLIIYNLYEYGFNNLKLKEVCRSIRMDNEEEYDFEKSNIPRIDNTINSYKNIGKIKCIKIKESEWEKIRNEKLIEKIDIM